jgi:hypothetical protein
MQGLAHAGQMLSHPSPFVCILLLRQDLANFAQDGFELELLLPLPL